MTTTKQVQHRVCVPMVQILGHVPGGSQHQAYERTLRHGDIVPTWVPQAEVHRLLAMECIEVLA